MQSCEFFLASSLSKAIKLLFPKIKAVAFDVQCSQRPEFGDFSTNVALLLAKPLKKSPMEVAEKIAKAIKKVPAEISITKPGFINFRLNSDYILAQLNKVLKAPEKISPKVKKKEKIIVEFVSANPTGPLHLGNVRGGFAGDTLCNILSEVGHKVFREYYINDVGKQVDNLGASVAVRYKELLGEKVKMPEGGYAGRYIIDLAKEILEEEGDQFRDWEMGRLAMKMKELALPKMLERIRFSVENLKIKFDNWFSETDLYQTRQTEEALAEIAKLGDLYETQGTIWFKSSKYGDDKDRVLKKEDGSYTYFASDIAYHKNKLLIRSFDRAITLVGADHASWVLRMKAALTCLGLSDRFEPIVFQLVRLTRAGKEVRLSKRRGEIITVEDLLKLVSLDVARYFFLTKAYDTHLDLDLDLMQKQSKENPVYYIQYAYARICSLEREARKMTNIDLKIVELKHEAEINLAKAVLRYPGMLEKIAHSRGIHILPVYLYELAEAFHRFYDTCRILSEPKKVRDSRYALAQATKIVLKKCLDLMRISAPSRM